MKRLFIAIITLVAVCTTAGAQKIESGSVASLKGLTRINVVFDYSETMVKKSLQNVEELKAAGVKEWVKDLPKQEQWCIGSLNDDLERCNMAFGTSDNVDGKLTIKVIAIDNELDDPIAVAIFTDKDGNELVKINVADDDLNGIGHKIAKAVKRGLIRTR